MAKDFPLERAWTGTILQLQPVAGFGLRLAQINHNSRQSQCSFVNLILKVLE